MADERWEEQFKQFLRKTGDDFRRAGEDVRAEAQRLFDAAVDPQKQQKVRDRLKVLTGWARKTAEDVAGMVETAASKAEQVFHRSSDKVAEAREGLARGAQVFREIQQEGGQRESQRRQASSEERRQAKALGAAR